MDYFSEVAQRDTAVNDCIAIGLMIGSFYNAISDINKVIGEGLPPELCERYTAMLLEHLLEKILP